MEPVEQIIYAVDSRELVLEALKSNIKFPHLKTVKNNGCDFSRMPPGSIGSVFLSTVAAYDDFGETIRQE